MSTDLFTVRPDDLLELVASVMEWRDVRHVPVEDDEGRLVGLVSHRSLLRLLAQGLPANSDGPVAVRSIMIPDPISVAPSTPIPEAVKLMRLHHIGSLPVVENERLVGIVTVYDLLDSSARLFEEESKLQGQGRNSPNERMGNAQDEKDETGE
jgi:CBS domain-containing protein